MDENEQKDIQTMELLIENNKNLEQKLRKYQTIAEEVDVPILIMDLHGYILDTNLAATKMYGYHHDEFVTMNIVDLNREETKEKSFEQMDKVQNEGITFETIHYRKDDSTFNAEVSLKRILIDQIDMYLGAIIDITQQKQIEEELKKSELRNHTMFDNAEDAILLFTDGRWVNCNAKALKIFGCTFEQIIGKHPNAFSPQIQPNGLNSREEADRMISNAYSKGSQFFEWTHCTADGIPFEAEVRLKRLVIDGRPVIQTVIRDVSDQKTSRETFYRVQAINSSIVNSTSDLIWSVDPNQFGLISFNQALSDYFQKMNVNIYIGMRPEDAFPNSEFSVMWHNYYERALKEDSFSIESNEYGGQTQFLLTFGLLKHEDKVFAISVFGKDITNEVTYERMLKEDSIRYQSLIESTNDWIWVVEPENYSLLFFNSALSRFFKQNYGILLKKGMTLEEMLDEPLVTQWKEYYSLAMKTGSFNTNYHTKRGNLHLSVSFLRLIVDNRIIGISIFGKDVTKEENYREQLEATNESLLQRLEQSINMISKIGELRDVYTAGHQKRVSELSCAIAKEMGLSDRIINNISLGALIHDIGKIYIASDILNKPGKISNLEFQIIQTHAEQGYEVLKEIDFPDQIKTMIYQHHERLDGSGYPQKLVGDQINLESRILAVADVVEAMTSHRPYRPALGIDAALAEIMMHKGTKFDAKVVDACLKLFNENWHYSNLD